MGGKPVHPLEVFTRDTFGEPFAAVILHGLGEDGGGTVCPPFGRTDQDGEGVQTSLSVTGHPPGNWGYRPLILAAIFKLLLERPELDDVLDFKLKELLDQLIWPDTPACRREVEDTLDVYSGCSYVRRDVDADGRVTRGSYYLILWRETVREFRPQSKLFHDGGNSVRIDPGLAEALREGAVSFAGISFGRLAGAPAVDLTEIAGRASVGSPKRPGDTTGKERELAMLNFPPPKTRPTVLARVTPVSQRRADRGPKIYSRPVGQIGVSIDTGAVARTVLRALHYAADRHPASPSEVDGNFDHVAEYVFREVDRQVKRIAHILVRRARRHVFEDALRYSYGVMHSMEVKSPRERGRKPTWHSPAQLVAALTRAIKAIEFEGWKPKNFGVTINRRWDMSNVQTATIKLVAAYWSEEEGMSLGETDSSKMRKWLISLGLSSFSVLRSEIRERIIADRVNQSIFTLCGGNLERLALVHSLLMPEDEASN